MVSTRAQIKKAHICFLLEDSDHQSSLSGALIGSNDDLLTEILLRLPVTSIIRFKSVSKRWRWLLSHKHFTQRYDKLLKSPGLIGRNSYRARNTYVPFDVENPSTPPFRSLDTYFDRPGFKIVQSCNGLLLCSTDRRPNGDPGALRYYVFNPTTKQLALIPPVPGGPKACKSIRLLGNVGLAFHHTDCVHYKVICICPAVSGLNLYKIHIYSSDARKWRISTQSSSEPISFLCPGVCGGVYWNGAVYWVPRYLCFKIDVEQLQALPLPVGLMSSEIVTRYFGESRGHLHLIAHNNCQENWLHLNVYEMLSDHSGWFVKFRVELDDLPGAFPEMIHSYQHPPEWPDPIYYDFYVIDVVRGEEEEDTFLVLKTPKNIIRYNVHDKSFKQIFGFPGCCYWSSDFHRYTETLSSF